MAFDIEKLVRVPIVCYDGNDTASQLEELGIKADNTTEVRYGYINVDGLDTFYPRADKYSTILEFGTDNYVIDMSVDEFYDLLVQKFKTIV